MVSHITRKTVTGGIFRRVLRKIFGPEGEHKEWDAENFKFLTEYYQGG
jgi:hypothetical protein